MTSKTAVKSGNRSPVVFWSMLVIALTVLLGGLGWAFLRTPQLNADEDVLQSLDSLFTAITARNESLLLDCEKRLSEMNSDGRIPPASWSRIASIMSMAKKNQWSGASKNLYSFIEAQRAAK